MTGELADGDLVQFIDNKGRRYQATLQSGKQFHSHSGFIEHDEIIGLPEASTVRTTRDQAFVVVRPTLSDFIFKMPRGAQVIYPKDIGPMLLLADIRPGAGSSRAVWDPARCRWRCCGAGADIVGYELREDFAERAQDNVARFLGDGALDRYEVQLRNCYDGIDESDLDRVVLDLPEPWQVVKHAERALRCGGILVAYCPSIVQVMTLRETLAQSRFFGAETRRGPAPDLARRRPGGQAGPPDGGPHRLPHPCPAGSVNGLDLLLIVLAILAAVGGWRLGFMTRAVGWVGAGLGLVVAVAVVPALLGRLDLTSDTAVFLLGAAGIVLIASLGQGIGVAIGSQLRPPARAQAARRVDSAGGSLLGIVGVAVLAWLVLPVMSSAQGWAAATARSSAIARFTLDHLPEPPSQITDLEKQLAGGEFPQIFAGPAGPPRSRRRRPTHPSPPMSWPASRPARCGCEESTCGAVQTGSGWLVGPDLIVTNAHVVAGSRDVTVTTPSNETTTATVVEFDPDADLALLRSPVDARTAAARGSRRRRCRAGARVPGWRPARSEPVHGRGAPQRHGVRHLRR